MAKETGAEFDIDPVCRVGEDISAKRTQYRLKHRDRHQANHQDIQGRKTAVNEDLIDNQLEKDRRNKREYLKKEGSNQHFPQYLAVLEKCLNKPGEIKALA